MLAELFFRELGGNAEPVVIVLHGLLGSSRNWMTASRGLAEVRKVVALDLRNHGNSPHVPEHTYPAMVEDVLGWMDAQGLQRATLLGHSMGGKVVMQLACAHPDRVDSLVVVDIAPRNNPPYHRHAFEALNAVPLSELESRREAEDYLKKSVSSAAMRQFLMTNLVRDPEQGFVWQVNLPALTESLEHLGKSPLEDQDQYPGPAFFVCGKKSDFVRTEDFDLIYKHFPAARIESMEGAGHNPHIEKREEFVAIVREFLEGEAKEKV